jgi:hypothetical protein
MNKLKIGDYVATNVAVYQVIKGDHFVDFKIIKTLNGYSDLKYSHLLQKDYNFFISKIKARGNILRILYGP